ncbi:hypothetical protein CK224_30175 [Mesorhizobium sp. WSM3862]|nr:hypothetical protein CK221_29330 [Mesorhizobium sp. WSM3868]PBB94732.1 hypothetical protein CK224_30175 [Mesorhizobium sp. WSM3862]
MIALFDSDCSLVAWLHDSGNIFDTGLEFVAFVRGGNVFSASNLSWLGPIDYTTLMDRAGRPVTFGSGHAPMSRPDPLQPLNPLKPLRPLRPLKPLTPLNPMTPHVPLGGWSTLSFAEYLAG